MTGWGFVLATGALISFAEFYFRWSMASTMQIHLWIKRGVEQPRGAAREPQRICSKKMKQIADSKNSPFTTSESLLVISAIRGQSA